MRHPRAAFLAIGAAAAFGGCAQVLGDFTLGGDRALEGAADAAVAGDVTTIDVATADVAAIDVATIGTAACHDGTKNGGESDVDCGGPCAPCDLGARCSADRDCVSGRCDASGGVCARWAKVLPSTAYADARAVAVRPNGDVAVVGYFDGTPSGDLTDPTSTATQGGYLVVYARTGELRRRLVVPSATFAEVATDAQGDLVVLGFFANEADFGKGRVLRGIGGRDVLVAKLDGDTGDVRWAYAFGGAQQEESTALAVGADGTIAFAAFTASAGWTVGANAAPPVASGQTNGVVVKLRPDGGAAWGAFVAYGGSVSVDSLAVSDAGDVYAAGAFTGVYPTLNADGGVGAVGDGGVPIHDGDAFFAKYSAANGALLWSYGIGARAYGSNVGPLAAQLLLDGTTLYAAGLVTGQVTFGPSTVGHFGESTLYVAALDTDGAGLAARGWPCHLRGSDVHYPSAALARGEAGALLLYGNYVCDPLNLATTSLSNRGDAGRDMFTAVLHPPLLDVVRAASWGSPADDQLTALARDPTTGNVVLVGNLVSQIDFDGARVTKPNASSTAGFVVSAGAIR